MEEVTEVEISRCTGHCCISFELGQVGPLDFGERLAAGKLDHDGDRWVLSNMLRYQGYARESPLGADYGNGPAKRLCHWYTCRFFDPQERLCTVYNRRPGFCRRYAVDHECTYPGCTRLVNKMWEVDEEMPE
jgi:Fe-S-cluster containining protein